MASEFALSAASSVPQVLTQPSRPVSSTGGVAAVAPTTVAGSSGQSPPPVNPGVYLDMALNIVVTQFFNAQGNVTQSIPSPRQLEAYREGAPDTANAVPTAVSV